MSAEFTQYSQAGSLSSWNCSAWVRAREIAAVQADGSCKVAKIQACQLYSCASSRGVCQPQTSGISVKATVESVRRAGAIGR